MASVIVCDRCRREIQPGMARKVIIVNNPDLLTPAGVSLTTEIDLHDSCYAAFRQWLREERERFGDMPKFKENISE